MYSEYKKLNYSFLNNSRMEQLNEDLLYLVFEYLPLDIKIQVGGKFLRRYEARNIQRLMSRGGYVYYLDDHIHRSDGPAVIWYFWNGVIQSKQWVRIDKLHRSDGPAYISYYSNSSVYREMWYQNGQICNSMGPYYTEYNDDGRILSESITDYDSNGIPIRNRIVNYTIEN